MPDKNARIIPSLKAFSALAGDLLNSQMPENANTNPTNWVILGRPAVIIPNITGNTAQVMAEVGATLAVCPMESARYKAAIP